MSICWTRRWKFSRRVSLLFLLSLCLSSVGQSLVSAAETGPQSAKVLWIYKSNEHFVAAPSLGDHALYIAALGAFNSGSVHALSTDPNVEKRVLWSKNPPYLKLPVVSSPAVTADQIIFGDGMHTTDGATLHCLQAKTGRSVWQLNIPGRLVHLESSPTAVGGKVYFGGGNAGVMCVDGNRLQFEGQDIELAALHDKQEARWKELQAEYEADKLKDPDLAVPPSESSLPKGTPKMLWQVGKDQWHVDASVVVSGEVVLAASGYLEDEKIGERRLFCLKVADGSTVWDAPLKYNPWGHATVAGDVVLIGTSSIRFDPKLVGKAKGEIACHDLKNGRQKWRKDLSGGILSGVVVQGDLAILAATDGKMRALDVRTGLERWSYTAAPFFASPAVTADTVYAADLSGVVHAVSLSDGKIKWKLDLAKDPSTKISGMVYGTPVLRDGRLYLGTCNPESTIQTGNAVICIGER